MIAPQKLFRHRTQNEIPATCGVGICFAWYWRAHANTIFGG